MSAWWERAVLLGARAMLVLGWVWAALVPVTAVLTVVGAVNRAEGAVSAGLRVPVAVDVADAAGRAALADVLGVDGVTGAGAEVGVSALGVGPAVVCGLLWTAIAAAAVPALWGVYRISRALTVPMDPDLRARLIARVRGLAGRVVLAGVAWSALAGASSAVVAAALDSAAVRASIPLLPAVLGLAAGSLLVLLAVVLDRVRALEEEQELTV